MKIHVCTTSIFGDNLSKILFQEDKNKLILTYIQFYNSTILRFYMNMHVTKKTQTLIIDYNLHVFNSTIQQFYDST